MMLHRITALNHGLARDFKIHSQCPTHFQAHMPRLTLSISQNQTLKPTALTPSSATQPSIPHHHSTHSTAQVGAWYPSSPLSDSISDPHPRRKQPHPPPLAACSTTFDNRQCKKCDQVERRDRGWEWVWGHGHGAA